MHTRSIYVHYQSIANKHNHKYMSINLYGDLSTKYTRLGIEKPTKYSAFQLIGIGLLMVLAIAFFIAFDWVLFAIFNA